MSTEQNNLKFPNEASPGPLTGIMSGGTNCALLKKSSLDVDAAPFHNLLRVQLLFIG